MQQINSVKKLLSKRVSLRTFRIEDAVDLQDLAGNKSVSETTLNIPYPYTLKMAEQWINSCCSSNYVNNLQLHVRDSQLIYAIIKNDSQQLIGTVSLVKIQNEKAQLGYWVGKPYWGQGYCSEAVALFIVHIKRDIGIKYLYAEHLQTNPASAKVMTNNAMSYIGNVEKIDRYGEMAQMMTYELFLD